MSVTSCRRLLSVLLVSFPAVVAAQNASPLQIRPPHTTESWWSSARRARLRDPKLLAEQEPEEERANERKAGLPKSPSTALPSTLLPDAAVLGTVFDGPADNYYPPDSQIAAGPSHLVAAINEEVVVYNKSGSQISSTVLSTFFQNTGVSVQGCCYDPQILYDQADGRFILTAAEGAGMSGTPAYIFLAVSQTSDPTGAWNKYAIETDDGSTYPDRPLLGLSSAAVYIASDQLSYISQPSQEWITVINLPELLAGSSNLTITRFKDVKDSDGKSAYGIQPAITYGSSSEEYLISTVGSYAGSVSSLHLFSIPTSGTPTLSKTSVPITTFSPPPNAVQAGSSTQILTGGLQMMSAVWINGSLWCTHGAADSSGANAVVRWYQIDAANNVVQQWGTVNGAGEAYYGAITVLPSNEAFLVYSTSSNTQYPSAGYAHRTASDASGTMSSSGISKGGTAAYTFAAGRWGDYSGISPDPSGASVWGIAEYSNPSNADYYGTAIANLNGSSSGATNGVTVTAPTSGGTYTSPVPFTAAATTTCSKGISAMGIYTAPGVLAYTVNGASLNTSLSLNPGTYNTTVQEWDNCGGSAKTGVTITVTSGSQYGVTVTAPQNNSTVASPVQFIASASSSCAKGIASMGIYTAPYQLAYTVKGASLNTSLTLSSGTYNTTVQEWDNCGGSLKTPVTITVSATASPGVSVTAPVNGSTVSSPVQFTATATTSCSKGVSAMGIYTAPYQLAYTVSGASLDTKLNLNPGTYNTTVEEWDNCGGAATAAVTITVR